MEKLYYVLDTNGKVLLKKYDDEIKRVFADVKITNYPEWQNKNLKLSEKGIKEYDSRFWAFAEEAKN